MLLLRCVQGGRDPIEKVGTPVSHDRNTPSLICQRQSMIPGKGKFLGFAW